MMKEDNSEWTIGQISANLEDALRTKLGLVREILAEAYRETATLKGNSYNSTCELETDPWFNAEKIRKISTPEIDRCRKLLIEGETHHQFACRFVDLMMIREVLQIGKLPGRIGSAPERRAAADFTTMMSNHELMLYQIFEKERGAKTHNSGMEMSTRYYITPNAPTPFLRYEAKVMVGLGLWSISESDGHRKSYRVRPGPYLRDYMRKYWEVVSWANDQLHISLSKK